MDPHAPLLHSCHLHIFGQGVQMVVEILHRDLVSPWQPLRTALLPLRSIISVLLRLRKRIRLLPSCWTQPSHPTELVMSYMFRMVRSPFLWGSLKFTVSPQGVASLLEIYPPERSQLNSIPRPKPFCWLVVENDVLHRAIRAFASEGIHTLAASSCGYEYQVIG